jgi:hypothetical protein
MNAVTADPVSRAMQEAVRSTAVATIKGVALAKVRACEPTLLALAERYRDVVYDLTTTKGLAEAKAARHDLRENGRYAVQRAEQAVKDEANAVKKEIAPEAERLIAIVKPTEDALDKLITVREAAIEAEKEVKRQAEAARIEKHRDGIAKIRAYVDHAKGLPASRIQLGVEKLTGIVFGEQCEEFLAEYETALAETIAALQRMHAETLASEQEQARLVAQKAEQERVAAELAEQKRLLDEQAAELKRQQDELEAQRLAAAAAALIDAEAGRAVLTIRSGAQHPPLTEPDPRPVLATITLPPDWAATAASLTLNTSAQQEAGQAATQGTAANPSPCQAQTASPDPDHAADAEAAMNAPRRRREAAAQAEDAPIETTEAEARPWSPSDGYVGPADADDTPLAGADIELAAIALLAHLDTELNGKWASHPKPSKEWWQFLRVKAASLQAHLNDEVLPG